MHNDTQPDVRLEQLKNWLTNELKFDDYKIEPASADASFRRYFRITQNTKTWIAMDAPPDKEDCEPFNHIAKMIEAAGVQAPHIYNWNKEDGFILLSDLGSKQYLSILSEQTADQLYKDAIDALIKMQTLNDHIPPYDQTLLEFELSLFTDWFLEKHLNLNLDNDKKDTLKNIYNLLINNALEQPKVFVHRDYHSRNLMLTDTDNPGVIDFQDAVFGPITYDLVSLLKDCYIAWPRENIESWIQYYLETSSNNIDRNTFIKWFDLMGVQRHLKAIGIFSRLNHRDNKPGYLNDIPRSLTYVFDTCQRYEELKPFSILLNELKLQPDHEIMEHIQ